MIWWQARVAATLRIWQRSNVGWEPSLRCRCFTCRGWRKSYRAMAIVLNISLLRIVAYALLVSVDRILCLGPHLAMLRAPACPWRHPVPSLCPVELPMAAGTNVGKGCRRRVATKETTLPQMPTSSSRSICARSMVFPSTSIERTFSAGVWPNGHKWCRRRR
jgi:hypothetical protein